MQCNVTGGADYNSGPYTVIFPIGSTNASFDIIINLDTLLEGDEKFNVSVDSFTSGHIVGNPGVATITIIDTTSKYLRMYTVSHFVFREIPISRHCTASSLILHCSHGRFVTVIAS